MFPEFIHYGQVKTIKMGPTQGLAQWHTTGPGGQAGGGGEGGGDSEPPPVAW